VTPYFAVICRLNHRTQFLCSFFHMISILGYCIPRG